MLTVLNDWWRKVPAARPVLVVALIALVVGAGALAVGYICLVDWLVFVRTFGWPQLDVWGGTGVLLGILPVVVFFVGMRPVQEEK